MSTTTTHAAVKSQATNRRVVHRTAGRSHGPITRVFSPGDIGQMIKPFVFLDRFDIAGNAGKLFAMHPHSGIATVTVMLSGSVGYEDSTGKSGRLDTGSVEWMNAGGGVWHTGQPVDDRSIVGLQLWVALPPELENAPASSQYLSSDDVPVVGPVRVVFGRYGNATSAVQSPASMTYLHVRLKPGERWRYEPPAGHTVAWVYANEGKLHTSNVALERELAVFNESESALEFEAEGEVEFVLGSAVKHPHTLVLGNYSVHTSAAALQEGEAGIERVAARLRAMGSLR